jgi:hypothetical protein
MYQKVQAYGTLIKTNPTLGASVTKTNMAVGYDNRCCNIHHIGTTYVLPLSKPPIVAITNVWTRLTGDKLKSVYYIRT